MRHPWPTVPEQRADRHKHHPITLRLPEDERSWLERHAAAIGKPVRAVLRQALSEYRRNHEGDENGNHA
jgi:hypothetical protein